jgi:succinate dehydrogenase (ubiquinone) membrane anchor subunit
LVDYVHARRSPVLVPAPTWALEAATVNVLVGVYYFNTEDIGE